MTTPYLLLLIRREDRDLAVGDVGPLHELLPPLHHGHPKGARAPGSAAARARAVGSDGTYEEVQRTRQDFLIVHAAVMPTSVLPAPQGRTMMPERARLRAASGSSHQRNTIGTHPFPNILLRLFSWYGRICAIGLRSMSRFAFLVSLRKSYSSSSG